MIPADDRFAFDLTGYIHLRGAIKDDLDMINGWIADAIANTDVAALHADRPELVSFLTNRPISRILDADPRFAYLLDHPNVAPYLAEFLGEDYRHIDSELYDTPPGQPSGGWHRGTDRSPDGHVRDGVFVCPMVKAFFCVTDVTPGRGPFAVVPGSHRNALDIDMTGRVEIPGMHLFDDVVAGDVILFNEGLLHNGMPNTTGELRRTVIINFGRSTAKVWPGYTPRHQTRDAVTERQRRILTNDDGYWVEPQAILDAIAAMRG